MKKLLIITYYWPPSGGAGVQRWLKLSNYLQESGVQVFVIAPLASDASYLTWDHSLEEEIHPEIKVIQTKSFEPLNLYKKIVGKKNVPTAGMANVNPNNLFQRFTLFVRSNLFIPDPRKYWGNYAYSAAKKLIVDEGISHIITSSPPHSVQRIGLKLKKNLKVHWTADLRDLWTGIYYYELLQHSKWSKAKDAALERKVLDTADSIITVSPLFKKEFLEKSSLQKAEKVHVIPNGFDPVDFTTFNYAAPEDFIITYTGSISTQYNIEPFLQAVKVALKEPQFKIKVRFVGYTDPQLMDRLIQLEIQDHFEIIPYVTHAESIKYLEKSFALLLVGPLNHDKNEGSVPAKVFEYLASRRPILYIGKKNGFVAEILKECKAGLVFDEDINALAKHLIELQQACLNKTYRIEGNAAFEKYSRKSQAQQLLSVLQQP